MLNVHRWYWTFQEVSWNGWSPLADQNRPADEDPGLPGAATNGPGTALPLRRTAQGSDLLTPVDVANDCTTLHKQEVVTSLVPLLPYSRRRTP